MKHLQNPNSPSGYVVRIFQAIQCSLGLSYMISISVHHEHHKKTTIKHSRKPVRHFCGARLPSIHNLSASQTMIIPYHKGQAFLMLKWQYETFGF